MFFLFENKIYFKEKNSLYCAAFPAEILLTFLYSGNVSQLLLFGCFSFAVCHHFGFQAYCWRHNRSDLEDLVSVRLMLDIS